MSQGKMNACRYMPGGQDPEDAFSLQVVFRKRALELVALLRKMTCNIRHPMHLRHPVFICIYIIYDACPQQCISYVRVKLCACALQSPAATKCCHAARIARVLYLDVNTPYCSRRHDSIARTTWHQQWLFEKNLKWLHISGNSKRRLWLS